MGAQCHSAETADQAEVASSLQEAPVQEVPSTHTLRKSALSYSSYHGCRCKSAENHRRASATEALQRSPKGPYPPEARGPLQLVGPGITSPEAPIPITIYTWPESYCIRTLGTVMVVGAFGRSQRAPAASRGKTSRCGSSLATKMKSRKG